MSHQKQFRKLLIVGLLGFLAACGPVADPVDYKDSLPEGATEIEKLVDCGAWTCDTYIEYVNADGEACRVEVGVSNGGVKVVRPSTNICTEW